MAKTDKMSRDIVERAKKAVGVVPRYASGTARLFLASGAEFFKNEMPAPIAMITTNQELLTDAVRFLRNPVDAINKQIDRALGSEDFKALAKFAKNALDDLKTGNLYDPVRDRSELGMQIDADLANFGGVDLGNFDENGDWMEGSEDNEPDIQVEIAKIQDRNDSKRTSATLDAINASTKAIVSTENANAQMDLRMSIKQHSQQMQAMENMITAQTSTFELINRSVQASMNVTREAHTQVVGKLDEMTGLLQKIADGVSPKDQKKPYREQEDIFGTNGELNIKQYLKQVAQNVDDKFAVKSLITNMTMGSGIKGLLELVQDNPWSLVASQIIQKVVPESVQKQMQRTNRNMESFFPALLQKLGERGRAAEEGRSDNPFMDMMLGMFGIAPRSKSYIETSYENPIQQAAITSKTTRAIEEVIPMWLARIDSHISGGPLMVYNYKTGKLENAGRVLASYEHSTKDLVGRMGDSAYEILDRAAMYKFDNNDEQKKFLDFVYRYLQKQGEENRFINPWSAEDLKRSMPSTSNADQYFNLLSGILTTMPRDKIMQASRDIYYARQSRDRNTYNTNNDLRESGLIAAWSGFMDEALKNRISSEANKTRSGLTDIEIDNISKSIHDNAVAQGGTDASNVLLADIVRTLRRGIITYSYNIGNKRSANIDKLPDYIKSRVKAADDVSQTQYRADDKVAERKQSIENSHLSIISAQNKRSAAERARSDRKESELFVTAGITAEHAASIQSAINYEADKKADPDNPAVVRRRQIVEKELEKLNGTRKEVLNKTGVSGAFEFLRKATQRPFELFEDALRVTDAFMFKMLFGEDAASNLEMNGEPYLLQTLTRSLNVHFKNATDWFSKNVGNPIKKYLLDDEKGLLPGIGRAINNIFGLDEKKERIKSSAKQFRDRMIGTRDIGEDGKPVGEYKGGRLSASINKYNSFGKNVDERLTGALDHFLYGKFANQKRKGVRTVTNRDSKGRFTTGSHKEYDGAIGKLRKAFDDSQEFLFGDPDSKEKWDKVKKEFNDALPDAVIGGGIGLLTGLFLPGGPLLGTIVGSTAGLVKGSTALSSFLFGEFSETETVEATDFAGDVIRNRKTGEAVKWKKQTKEGLISQKVYEGMKQYVPGVTMGSVAGAIAGGVGLLPFGLGSTAGAVIGGMGGMLASSNKFKEMLFGNMEDPKSGLISKEFRDKVKNSVLKYAPGTITGAAIGSVLGSGLGLIPGLSLLPTGPIMGFLGASVGMSQAEKFDKFLFGEEVETETTDPNDSNKKIRKKERQGGVFGRMFNFARDKVLTPFAKRIDDIGTKIGQWFHEDILGPLGRSMKPIQDGLINAGRSIRDSMLNIGDTIATGIMSAFNINIGGTLKDFVKDKVIPKFKKVTDEFFGAIGKMIGGILSAPFKALEYIVTGTIYGGSDDHDGHYNKRVSKRKEKQKERSKERKEKSIERLKKNAADVGGHISSFFSRFFGTSKDGKLPTVADNQIVDSKGRVRGNANTADAPKVIRLGPGTEAAIAVTENDKGETKVSPTTATKAENDETKLKSKKGAENSSDKIDDKNESDEASSDERTTRKRFKVRNFRSNNSYLKEIADNTKKIFGEMRGQLGGTGWNVAYIKTLLERQYGGLSDDELPEEMEGSKKVRKKRTIFGKLKDAASDRFHGMVDGISRFFGFGKDKDGEGGGGKGRGFGMLLKLILKPFSIINKALEIFGDGLALLTDGLIGAAQMIGNGIKDAIETLGGIIKGAAPKIGEALGEAATFVAGAMTDIGLSITSTARGIVEFVSDNIPEVGHLVIKGIGAVGRGLFKGASLVGQAIGGAGRWAFNKLTGKNKDGVSEKVKNIGTFRISGGYLDNVNETVVNIGDVVSPKPFPWTTVFNGVAIRKVTDAIPVYILGVDPNANMGNGGGGTSRSNEETRELSERLANMSDEEREWYMKYDHLKQLNNKPITLWAGNEGVAVGPDGTPTTVERTHDPVLDLLGKANVSTSSYAKAYAEADRRAEKSKNPGEVYDRMIKNAKSREEIEAIQTAQQLNVNNQQLATTGDSESEKGDGTWLDTLLRGGKTGLAKSLLSAFAGTTIGAMLMKGLGAAKTGVAAAGTTAAKNLPFLAGTAMAVNEGDTDRVITNVGRQGIRATSWLTRSISGAADIVTTPEGAKATSKAASGVGAKLIAGLRTAINKVLTNSTVKKMLSKIPKVNANKIAETVLTKFDDVLLRFSGEALEQLLKKANWVVMIATAVYDFGVGCYNAANIFEVASGEVTLGMRLSAGLGRALSGLAFGLIPVNWLSQAIYKMVASEETEQELKTKQDAVKAMASASGMSTDEYLTEINGESGGLLKGIWNGVKSVGSKIWNFIAGPKTPTEPAWGTGTRRYSQKSAQWNTTTNNMALTGCGPTAAAIVASAYGDRNANPAEANKMSYGMGMRAADGGTNPEFFKQYAAGKGYGMEQGPTSSGMVQSNLSKGRPVVLMGRGGAFGNNMHYLVADKDLGKGRVGIIDPLTGGSKSESLGGLMKNTTTTIYSYGKGPGDASSGAQNALVDTMNSIRGRIRYSLKGDQQNPDNGAASCASTVGWAYRKVLGGNFETNPMSASSTTQSKDSRFQTVWRNDGVTPLNMSILQPGDIMYMNWDQIVDNGKMKHTEMYAGNGTNLSHGGPGNGPVVKNMNAYRKKHLMQVRRYTPFIDGDTPVYNNAGSSTTTDTNTAVSGTSLMDQLSSIFSGINARYDNIIGSLFGNKPTEETADTSYGTGRKQQNDTLLTQFESWGSGPSANLSSMNDKIRRINRSITKTRAEAAQQETAVQVTSAITDAVNKATSSDHPNDQMLTILTASLGKMIELLSEIKDNTAPKDDDDDRRTTTPDRPTVRADHFDSDTGVGGNATDIGARIIDNLTSK